MHHRAVRWALHIIQLVQPHNTAQYNVLQHNTMFSVVSVSILNNVLRTFFSCVLIHFDSFLIHPPCIFYLTRYCISLLWFIFTCRTALFHQKSKVSLNFENSAALKMFTSVCPALLRALLRP